VRFLRTILYCQLIKKSLFTCRKLFFWLCKVSFQIIWHSRTDPILNIFFNKTFYFNNYSMVYNYDTLLSLPFYRSWCSEPQVSYRWLSKRNAPPDINIFSICSFLSDALNLKGKFSRFHLWCESKLCKIYLLIFLHWIFLHSLHFPILTLLTLSTSIQM